MTALKEVGTLAGHAGGTCLASFPLWNQDVSTIVPAQVHTFVAKMKMNDRLDEVESAVEIVTQEVPQAVARNEIAVPPLPSYHRPTRVHLTTGEFKRGLTFLGDKRASAVLFGLEMELPTLTDVARLTYRQLAVMTRTSEITPIAKVCLDEYPRHITSPYVFWKELDDGGVPIFGLDEAIFDAFGLVWAELTQVYADIDREALEGYLNK